MIKLASHFVLSLFIVNLFAAPGFSQAQFEKHFIDDNFNETASVFAGDVDGDGDTDVVGAGAGNGIAWWRNDGGKPIVWTRFTIDLFLSGAMSVYAIDVDGDKDLDVLGAGWSGNVIVWYRNNGGNPIQWQKQTIESNFINAHEVFADDFDADGDADVFGASAGLNQVAWWRNDGGNPTIWLKQVIDSNIRGARSIFVTDLDGDGDKDAVAAGLASNEVSWYRNDGGDPVQWREFTVSNSFTGSHRVYVCDMDQDGDPDLLGAAFAVNQIAWWRNEGGNPLAWSKQIIDSQCPAALVAHAADLDGDGDPDVASTANAGDDLAWYRNDGGNPIIWKKTMLDDNFDGAWPVHLCDIDGDGDMDILAGADTADDIVWWENINVFLQPNFGAVPHTGNVPVTIQFHDSCVTRPPVRSWQWDFDNDGRTDAWEQNPLWTFVRPGNYNVRLVVANDSLTRTLVKENFIRIFDGESALEFDGRDSFVRCPASPSLSLEHTTTIEAWINPEGWGSVQNIGFGRIMDKKNLSLFLNGDGGTLNPHSLVLWLATTGGTAGYINTQANTISLNQWQHVAMTYDGNLNTVKVYLNGIEQTLHQASGQLNGAIMDNSRFELRIGSSANRMTFAGVIDEMRIWNIVRSAEEIQVHMRHYLKGDEPGLVGYWQLNEGQGTRVGDRSAHANDGTVEKAQWVAGNRLEQPVGVVMLPEEDSGLASGFMLAQNYPNPFNSSTTIRFVLPKSDLTTLAIYDITGRLVSTLIDNELLKPGEHSVQWHGTSSGVYVSKLVSGNLVQVRKLVLIK